VTMPLHAVGSSWNMHTNFEVSRFTH